MGLPHQNDASEVLLVVVFIIIYFEPAMVIGLQSRENTVSRCRMLLPTIISKAKGLYSLG